jgi:hypothetical protein
MKLTRKESELLFELVQYTKENGPSMGLLYSEKEPAKSLQRKGFINFVGVNSECSHNQVEFRKDLSEEQKDLIILSLLEN